VQQEHILILLRLLVKIVQLGLHHAQVLQLYRSVKLDTILHQTLCFAYPVLPTANHVHHLTPFAHPAILATI